MNKRLVGVLIGLIIIITISALYLSGILKPLELMAYDWRFRLRGPATPLEEILIVKIDEKSVRDLNRKISEWPRSYYAGAIKNLKEAGAELIVMDIDLSKPSFNGKGEDEALAGAIYDANNLVLARYITQGQHVLPMAAFRSGEVGEGFINNLVDSDGVLRNVPLVSLGMDEETGDLVPHLSLSLETARLYLYPNETHPLDLSAPDLFKMADISIPYPEGKMMINYAGPSGTFKSISFSDIYNGRFDIPAVKGKIVLVGNTHPAYHDYFMTPFIATNLSPVSFEAKEVVKEGSIEMSGVEIHANAIQTILKKGFIKIPDKRAMLSIIVLSGLVFALIFIILDVKPVLALFYYILFSALIVYISYILFGRYQVMVEIVPLEGILAAAYVTGVAYRRVLAMRDKAQVTRTFGHYVSYQVVDRLLKEPELVRLGGEKKELTVLFSDIRGFTTISEKLEPEEVVRLLNEYLTAMTRVVFKYDGVLDKYMGDAIMAFYGAPIEMADHADKACLTALEMIEVLKGLQAKWKETGVPVIDIGIGLNSGPMIVGNMGSDVRFDYTVMGDSVNLGSRLEGINKQYGTRIIVSEFTRNIASSKFNFRELDLVRVKGKNDPVRIYELMSEKDAQPLFLEVFEKGLIAYRGMDWYRAESLFQQALSVKPDDGPSSIYIKRCLEYKKTPPLADWDGVYEMKTK